MFCVDDQLTVNATGDYTYQVPKDTAFDNVNIEYALKEPGSSDTDSAMLYIRSAAYKPVPGGAGGSHNVIGGGGNDILYGSDGDDVLTGGRGNDIMYGGDGSDTFAWRARDYESGKDVIMDYTLGKDRLSFADIFDTDAAGSIPVGTILTALQADKIDISVDTQNNALLNVKVNHSDGKQNVLIHLTNSPLTSMQADSINAGDEAAKAALLQQMLTNLVD